MVVGTAHARTDAQASKQEGYRVTEAMVVKGNELARLSLADAQAVKWAAGRDKYGETWAGEHPLYEAFSDAIDVLNYLDEAERQGCEVPARVHHDARCLALSIRSLAELRVPD